jgi:hypothetical protein
MSFIVRSTAYTAFKSLTFGDPIAEIGGEGCEEGGRVSGRWRSVWIDMQQYAPRTSCSPFTAMLKPPEGFFTVPSQCHLFV